MPGLTVPIRRSRATIETERDADNIRGESRPSSAGSNAVKRPRLMGQLNGPLDATPEPGSPHDSLQNGAFGSNTNGDVDGDSEAAASDFHPGAIVRVKVTDFVTYQNAEFFPGPNLNMVIGPNGTGKSSLVCAICLGLGWGPQHLGRAQHLSDFVRHGMKEAFVEIELQGDAHEDNHTIRLRIIRDTNGREWWLNKRKCKLRAVQALMQKLNIQIDNLCQFLPQDKVSEFAALSPVDLLHQTLRAAAPEHMIESHEKLKDLRKSQKMLQQSKSEDQEKLDSLEVRQQNLRAEVEKVRKRKEIQDKINLLEKAIIFVEYNTARALHKELKAKAQAAERKLKDLERRVEPLMRSVNEKQEYQQQIEVVVKERKRAVEHAERAADQALSKIQDLEKAITENEADIASRIQNDSKRKADVAELQNKIREVDARISKPPPEFNANTWNERIRETAAARNPLRMEQKELSAQDRLLVEKATKVREERAIAEQELAGLESQAGQQASKIGRFSPDVQKAWKWIQDNMGEFEKEVYGPPMITCSVKDPRYLDQLEAVVGRNSLLTITTQTKADNKKLADKLRELRLQKVRYVYAAGNIDRRPVWSDQQLKDNGLDVWAFDLIDGPDPVLDMMFNGRNRTPLGIKDVNDDQLDRISKCSKSIQFIAGRTYYTTTYRAEYDQSSTSTRNIRPAQLWTDAPVDESASREVQQRIANLEAEFEKLQAEVRPVRGRIAAIKTEIKDIDKEADELSQAKAAEQKARGQYDALPTRKEQYQRNLEARKKDGEDVRQQIRQAGVKWDENVLEKANIGLRYKDMVAQIRACHEELLEAEVRRIEAVSDVDSLKEKNAENARKLDEGRQAAVEAKRLSDLEREKARRSLEAVQTLLAEAEENGTSDYFQRECSNKTVEGIENEMAAEKAKLELIHTGNPNAIRDFEERQKQLDRLQEKMESVDRDLAEVDNEITQVRGEWEPELDKLVAEISDAFAFNFERIGCNGEVGVRKEEDFDLWAIEIRVKFRENEILQILDAHRQSGGERSVSTIFYLMALQSLAKSPFRVVDEINQGMDPRNERMVHERMVEIACQEHTSQYFLITPKLLTGLRYDKRMKVLCIASGEFMPENYKSLNISKIIGMRRAMMAA